ncbi:unnamed protein product [Rotaria socialis]|uniref:Ras-GEF domain-containing protein n=2 Tax=Rotaria TaxID=231623 RepID=A0A819VFW3_9BILA|nr:unnamed protein product [Rotaria socialis]CAF4321560.1 unnamed protein product [Rotaria socialis]CAF4597974.1 unnamed protein product [Rotaria socialis]
MLRLNAYKFLIRRKSNEAIDSLITFYFYSSELDTTTADSELESSALSTSISNKSFNRSTSNPDLSPSSISNKSFSTSLLTTFNGTINDEDNSTFVVKVYRSDQSYKYFPVLKDTTAKQVVMLAITEFSIVDQSRYYSLCEVSVENNVIKQKRLPDHIDNLPERLPINARYYLKNNLSTETLVPDHLSNEFIREARIHFLQLDALEVCAQLTLRDFSMFKSIQATEYVDHIFKVKSPYGIPHLEKFLRLPNEETYWTITEIIRETNLLQRSKAIKHFIKIAKSCKDMKNFNSMFSIVSGLDHKTVQRLQATWERVPEKYKKLFEELKSLLDLSRNMSVYRNLLKNDLIVPPIIPMFPICMKDLTFINLGNQSDDDNLINFEKLRMIAKEIRYIMNMASSPYDMSNMFDSPTSHSQVFAGFGHQTIADSFGTMRRHHTGTRLSASANAKRIYDEALMVKKVKAYLNNAEIIEDEDRLIALANQCEPVNLWTSSSIATFVEFTSFVDMHALENKGEDDEKPIATTDSGDSMNAALSRIRIHSSPSRFHFLKNPFRHNAATLKRRPSPSTSSLSSNSSGDRRTGTIQLTKFGTQSPDAVNKLLRLSDSSHQTKARAPIKPNPNSSSSIFRNTSPLIGNPMASTALTSVSETTQSNSRRHQHMNKMRDANKLTSESSSLNFKPVSSTVYVRSQITSNPNNNDLPKSTDSGNVSPHSTDTYIGSEKSEKFINSLISDEYSSMKNRHNSMSKNQHNDDPRPIIIRNWMQRSKSQTEINAHPEEPPVDYDDAEQVTAV